MQVVKRDGSFQKYDEKKVIRAILMAFHSAGEPVVSEIESIANEVTRILDEDPVAVETVQNIIEETLFNFGYGDVAREYIIYRYQRDKIRDQRLSPDSKALAEYIHAAKYARYTPERKRRETFEETVIRVQNMHIRKFPLLTEEIVWAFNFVRERKVLPSMRSMQFAGPAIEKHNERMYNCSFTVVDRVKVFQEIMFLLLCGCGVGYSVRWEHISKLPPLGIMNRRKIKHYVIADSIEGWADAVGALIQGSLTGEWVEFAYHMIRDEGSILHVSGGRAPGHVGLRESLEACRSILLNAQGRQLRPIEVHDIICHIAEAVLSGGIRRSSLLCLFSPNDTEMMYCKSKGMFDPVSGHNAQRMMANNSVALSREDKETFDRVIKIAQEGYGEPGFFFTEDIRYGTNPCGEIGLDSKGEKESGFGFCNLTEVNVATCEGEEDFYDRVRAATIIGTLQAAYTNFTYVSNEIAERDALLGVSLTGIMDNPDIGLNAEILQKGRLRARVTNNVFADKIGINRAQRITCVKPSGTASLALGGVGSGIHPHHARRYFRRVTANPTEPVAQYMKRINPHMVFQKPNGDWVITFCVKAPDTALTLRDMTAEEFIRNVILVCDSWIEDKKDVKHNVSCTVTIKEGDDIGKIIWENRYILNALAYAPDMLDKIYPFAPRETVMDGKDEVFWNNLIEEYKEVDWEKFVEDVDNTSLQDTVACEGDKCELKENTNA